MKLVAKRSSYGSYGNVERGGVITVEDDLEAKKLIKSGKFIKYDADAAAKAKADQEVRAAEKQANAVPLLTEAEANNLLAENARLTGEIDQLTIAAGRVPELENQIAANGLALSEASTTIADLTSKVSDLAGSLKASEAATASAKTEADGFKAKMEELAASITATEIKVKK